MEMTATGTAITVTGKSIHEIKAVLDIHTEAADMRLFIRCKDFGRELLPGLLVKVSCRVAADRDFETLDEAIAYIRKMYKLVHEEHKELRSRHCSSAT